MTHKNMHQKTVELAFQSIVFSAHKDAVKNVSKHLPVEKKEEKNTKPAWPFQRKRTKPITEIH